MTALGVWVELRGAGIEVSAAGENLRLSGNTRAITEGMRARVLAAKPALLSLVTARARLLAIAAGAGLSDALGEVPDDELNAYDSQPDQVIVAGLRILHDQRLMATGVVPEGWTEPVTCQGCGPLYLWPGCPSHVIACPWCRHRKAGVVVPRPAG